MTPEVPSLSVPDLLRRAIMRPRDRPGVAPFQRLSRARIANLEACSAFTRVTACMLADRPKTTLCTRGFVKFVASPDAPIATGWSDSCRAGLTPAGDVHLFTAH